MHLSNLVHSKASSMSTNSKSSNNTSSSEDDMNELRRGPWTVEEDTLLIHHITRHGEGRWNLLAKRSGYLLITTTLFWTIFTFCVLFCF